MIQAYPLEPLPESTITVSADLNPPATHQEVEMARALLGVNATSAGIEACIQSIRLAQNPEGQLGVPSHQIRVVKPNESAIIPDHKQQLLRRIGNAQAEIGRLNKLLDEIRADVLHLTTE